ncbi:MAG: twitching motility protein PilT [Chloroflexi bacterium]|nr:MAG: twitching motility protein PilT [Chloroflexota bacterium]
MAALTIQFHGELNDFLPPARREQALTYVVAERQSIKDVIEALGVPHPEVGQIVVHGRSLDFDYLVQADDYVEVYPAYSACRLPEYPQLQPVPAPRFVLDVHLGRLAEYLRLLGFDTLYRNDYDDPQLAAIAGREQRILLTRDLGLLKRSVVTFGVYVRATDPQRQVLEIVGRFNLWDALHPFQRCSRCNGMLEDVPKAAIEHQLLPQTKQEHDAFKQCQACGQIYWAGSHFVRLREFIDRIRAQRPPGAHQAYQP